MEDRIIYKKLKSKRISTLDVSSVLTDLGIIIPKRTLQYYLDTNFRTCSDVRVEQIAITMIRNYDNLLKELKNKFKS